jgi:hypothetical protein
MYHKFDVTKKIFFLRSAKSRSLAKQGRFLKLPTACSSYDAINRKTLEKGSDNAS